MRTAAVEVEDSGEVGNIQQQAGSTEHRADRAERQTEQRHQLERRYGGEEVGYLEAAPVADEHRRCKKERETGDTP
jgi:hypothetical protein